MIKVEDDMRCGWRRIRVSDNGKLLQRYEAIHRMQQDPRWTGSPQLAHLQAIERARPSQPRR